ncbi:hypothetical protein [Vulcanococcus limneticus]|uniref:hypothetical protein n=1 Tax=Vulcanococcus limneticus TaxID=2170428 RepID=UPI00398C1625
MQDTMLLTPWPGGSMDRNLASDIVTWAGIIMPITHHGRLTHDPTGSSHAELHNQPAKAYQTQPASAWGSNGIGRASPWHWNGDG